jgi:hypothetical protein
MRHLKKNMIGFHEIGHETCAMIDHLNAIFLHSLPTRFKKADIRTCETTCLSVLK